MKLKKLLCTALSAALLCTAALAAGIPTRNPEEPVTVMPLAPNPETTEGKTPEFDLKQEVLLPVMVWGSAVVEDGRVRVTNDNEGAAYAEIVLNVSEDTAILDAVTGEARTLDDIKEGETVYAYAGPAMTFSLPPQANAVVLLCNFPADFGSPIYAEVQRVTPGENGKASVLMSNDIVLHLNAETEILTHGSEAALTLADIVPGTRLLSWYNVVMESFPAQAVPSKVMVFPGSYTGYTEMSAGAVSVNGTELAAAPFVDSGRLMVPLRAFAEALGCDVAWDAAAGMATVSRDGEARYALRPGEDTALVEGDMVMSLTVPSLIRENVAYVAAEDLIAWHGVKLVGSWPVV